MDPALALLDTQVSPLRFGHEMGLGDQFGNVFGQHDVPVLELLVVVLVQIVDLLVLHDREATVGRPVASGSLPPAVAWHFPVAFEASRSPAPDEDG